MLNITPIEGGVVWLVKRGQFFDRPLFQRGSELFVKMGSAYVRLQGNNTTSVDKLFWREVDPGAQRSFHDNGLQAPTLDHPYAPAQKARGKKPKLAA
tara:strand:- start:8923 stop:9213 length:291 start_codon:yes stop_codon:yes gene_type:complete